MIPSIETIVEDLAAGTITKAQAITWLYMHAEGAANDLRDMFAGQALAGWRANPNGKYTTHADAAEEAYRYADAMLTERAKAESK